LYEDQPSDRGNCLVTYHNDFIAALDRVWSACLRDGRYLQKGMGRILYRLADEMVAGYLPVAEKIDEAIDGIEDRVFDDPQPSVLEQIFRLKRMLLHLRRVLMHQREVLNKLSRGDYPLIDFEDRFFSGVCTTILSACTISQRVYATF
jgi:magnesium transporter